MAAIKYVSFFEVRLADAGLQVRMGSGLGSDVQKLPWIDPAIRVCLPESAEAGQGIRGRFGWGALTDDGLMPIQGNAQIDSS